MPRYDEYGERLCSSIATCIWMICDTIPIGTPSFNVPKPPGLKPWSRWAVIWLPARLPWPWPKLIPKIFATIGVHPHEAKEIKEGWYESFRSLARQPKVVAYGEIGLDYHYDHSPREVQRQRFREQIHLAHELALPLIIHTREGPGRYRDDPSGRRRG